MAEVTTIARPYAEAVFQLADKANALDTWSQTLARMATVAEHPEIRGAIGNPKLTDDQVSKLFVESCGGDLVLEARNFITLLVDNGRLGLLPEVYQLFERSKREREGVVEAHISSAFPLDGEQLATLVARLETKFKRKVSPVVSVDKDLIGGVKIVVGDEVLDASVRGKLASMRAALTS
jgi:F-type H+-transporting ATPase subunit delta